MQQFYSNGKLMLTGEYYVLDGAKSLALPARRGQDMIVRQKLPADTLHWYGLDDQANCWLQAILELPSLKATTSFGPIKKLQTLLQTAVELNPDFLASMKGVEVITRLGFPRDWGLGSSSTLINNLAQWAEVDPYKLLDASFGGSGYDIACAQTLSPIIYQKINQQPTAIEQTFDPNFSDSLYFVHLAQKQSSIDAIRYYLKNRNHHQATIEKLNKITEAILKVEKLNAFEDLLNQHEEIIADKLLLKTAKNTHFPDYWGSIKSLGAWGGDFVLATSNRGAKETRTFFNEKGFSTFIPWKKMLPTINAHGIVNK